MNSLPPFNNFNPIVPIPPPPVPPSLGPSWGLSPPPPPPALNEPLNGHGSSSLWSISEDLTQGRQARKDENLKLLVRENGVPANAFSEMDVGPAPRKRKKKRKTDKTTARKPSDRVRKEQRALNGSSLWSHPPPPPPPPLVKNKSPSRLANGDSINAQSSNIDGDKQRQEERKSSPQLSQSTKAKKKRHRKCKHRNPSVAVKGNDYPPGVKIIYMIHCSYGVYYHTSKFYEDHPEPSKPSVLDNDAFRPEIDYDDGGLVHMNGTKPIYDPTSSMMEDDGENDVVVLIVRHVYCTENQFLSTQGSNESKWRESIVIKSARLRGIINQIAKCYYRKNEELPQTFDIDFIEKNDEVPAEMTKFIINPASLFLFHHSPLLELYASEHVEDRYYIKPLLDYCQRKFGTDFEDARRLFDAGLVSQQHLDKLFLPNTVVVQSGTDPTKSKADSVTAFVISSWPDFDTHENMFITGWSWSPNGGLVRTPVTAKTSSISAEHVPISSLPFYPLNYASMEIRQALETRGRKFCSLHDGSHVSYTGYDVPGEQYYPESRFMIDYSVYRKMHGNAFLGFAAAPIKKANDSWPLRLDERPEPLQEDFLLMPAQILGFYLMEKHWIRLWVDNVNTIKWNKSAFDRLVLPPNTKELIRALVSVRTSQRGIKQGLGIAGKRTDIISGKGNGLILLLHGSPGTGKTLTAESVAEIAEMPLYRVTCGDIGTTPEGVEKYLELVMHLGTTWNCVLLLDEADIFLEERSFSDLARNSLVSVFLRILEYYDGILILTSNRVGTFDDAFRSRIQVALHYENLTRSARKKIWTNFIDMLEEDQEDADISELRLHLDELAAFDMNGRHIRNTVTTARQLAAYQNRRLDWDHVDRALKVSVEFNTYLQKVHGHTEDQRARDENLR